MIAAGYYIPQDGCAMFGRGTGKIGEETVGRRDHSKKRESMGTLEWKMFYRGDMHQFVSSQDRMGGAIPEEWKSGYPMGRDPRYPPFPKSYTREGGCGGTPYENQRRGYIFQRRPMAEGCRFDRDALAELVQTAQTGTREEKEELQRRHKAILTPRSDRIGRPLVGIPEMAASEIKPGAAKSVAAQQQPSSAAKKAPQNVPSSSTGAGGQGGVPQKSPEKPASSRKSRDGGGHVALGGRRVMESLRPVLGGWTNKPIPEGYTAPEEAKRLYEEQMSADDAGVMPLSPFTGLVKAPPPPPSDGDASVAECLGRRLALDGGLVSTPPPKDSARKKSRPRPVSGCDPAQWRSNYSASYY